jgi:hypothetical protein
VLGHNRFDNGEALVVVTTLIDFNYDEFCAANQSKLTNISPKPLTPNQLSEHDEVSTVLYLLPPDGEEGPATFIEINRLRVEKGSEAI